jgi:membrane dipeptidase
MSETIPFLDGHNDVLLRLYRRDPSGRAFFVGTDTGHLDFPRARAGGFAGGFFAVFVPIHPDEPDTDGPTMLDDGSFEFPLAGRLELGYSQKIALEIMAVLFRMERVSDGALRVVRSIDELVGALRHDVMASILHFEGAEAIDPHLGALETFYNAGLRSLGIVWSRPNAFAEGVPFAFPRSPDTGPGLTDAGCALVRACNELGIMIDLSHINEQGFRDVAKLSNAPLVATHSNAHALCPSTRNLTDWQLDAIRDSGGIVGLNFGVCFLRDDGGDDPEVPIEVMAQQIDYLVDRMGIAHVGFGSDFDGVTIPLEMGDVAGMPKLIGALRARGYDDEALRMIAHENWVRVLSETWC